MFLSLQEMLPAAEDSSSLLLVVFHQKLFLTDWRWAQPKKAFYFAFRPLFHRTGVIAPLPKTFTSPNPSDKSGPIWHSSYFSYCCHIYLCCRLRVNIVCVFSGEQLSLLLRHPDQPANSKVLKVAIIGAPNAGKSTLSNQLLGRKVSSLLSAFQMCILMCLSLRAVVGARLVIALTLSSRCLLCPRKSTPHDLVPWAS